MWDLSSLTRDRTQALALRVQSLKHWTTREVIHFSVVAAQSLSTVWFFVTSWTAAHQASLSFTISQSLLKLISIESVMPSNHLIHCRPLLLLPSVFPSIRVFSNEPALHIRWPKYWSFRFSISLSSEYLGLNQIFFFPGSKSQGVYSDHPHCLSVLKMSDPRKCQTSSLLTFLGLVFSCHLLSWSQLPGGKMPSKLRVTPLSHSPLLWVFFFFNFVFLIFVCLTLHCCAGLSLVVVRGSYSSLWCPGFLLRLLLLWGTGPRHAGFSSCHTGFVALRHVWSSWTGDWSRVPCTDRQFLIHCVTREVLFIYSFAVPLFWHVKKYLTPTLQLRMNYFLL